MGVAMKHGNLSYFLVGILLLWNTSSTEQRNNNGTKQSSKKVFSRIHNQEIHPKPKRFTSIRPIDPIPYPIEHLTNTQTIHNIDTTIRRKGGAVDVLVIIESLPSAYSWREAIRTTWATPTTANRGGTSSVFIVFVIPLDNQEPSEIIAEEISLYRDMVLFKSVSHSEVPSVKLMQYMYVCNQLFEYTHLLRTVDSYYIRTGGLLSSLSTRRETNTGQQLVYMGYFKGNQTVDLDSNNRWFLCPHLVPHADEGMYLLSKSLIDRLIRHSIYLNYYPWEGASIGLWLSPFRDVHVVHNVDIDSFKSRGCWNSIIATRETTPEDMKSRHHRLNNGGIFCEEEIVLEPSYRYDWSRPPKQCCTKPT